DRVGEGRDAIGRGGVEDGVVFGRDRARVDTGQTLVEPAQIAAQAAAGEELVTVLVTVQHLLIALGEGLELHRGAITGGPLFGVEGAHDRYATPAGQPAQIGVVFGRDRARVDTGQTLVEPAQIAAQAAAGEELVTVLVTVQHLLIALGEGLELHRGAITGGPLFGVEGAHDRYATPAGQPA